MSFRSASPDRLLRRFCRSGDPRALGELFDRTAGELLRVAAWLCGNRADAEDLLQRTFVSVIEFRDRYDRRRRALPWLCGILGNHAHQLQEARARRLATGPLPGPAPDPLQVAADAEFATAVAQLQTELGTPYREVLDLHLGQGLNAKEIAARLGRPAGTVRTQLVRALEQLRRRLPGGFVAGLAVVSLPNAARLAALKSAVMATAQAAAPTAAVASTGALVTGGVLMGKKLLLLVPVVLMLGLVTYAGWPFHPAVAAPPVGRVSTVTAALDGRAGDPAAALAAPAAADRVPAPPIESDEDDPGFARVRITVRWDHDGSPARQVGVHIERVDRSRLFGRAALTDANGNALLRHVVPGRYYAGHAIGDYQTIDVASGETHEVALTAHQVGTARGLVVDSDGQPVADARIWVSDNATHVSGSECARSDAAGRFTVPLNNDHYVGARKAGYAPSLWQYLMPHQGQVVDLVLTLRGPGGSVHGVVRDPRGRPIRWAQVLVGFPCAFGAMGSTREKMLSEPMGDQVVTDRDGRFTVDGVRLGGVDVHVWARGHAPCRQSVLVQEHAIAELEVTLAPSATLTGTVRDAGGRPVAGANIAFGDYSDFACNWASSDAAGRYRLEDLPTGKLELRAGKDEVRAQTALELLPGVTSEWDPVLGSGPTITGSVLGADDQPLADVQVGCVERHSIEPRRWQATGGDGRFTLTDFGDQPVDLQVRIGGAVVKQLHAVAPGTRDLVIHIAERELPTAKLHGAVLDALGAPVAASVWAHRGLERFAPATTTDAASGTFALGPVPPGEYVLTVDAPGRGYLPYGPVVLAPHTDLALGELVVQSPGRLQLELRDAQGRLVEQAFAVVQTSAGQQAGSARIEHGKATVEPLQPGRLFVHFETGHGESASAEFEVRSDATTTAALQTQPAARVTIRFRDPDQVPDLSVRARLLGADGKVAAVLRTFPENEEPLRVQSALPVGTWQVQCTSSDQRTATRELVVRDAAVPLELSIDLPTR